MKTEPILNILSLEDSDTDYEIIREQLIEAGLKINLSRVQTETEFVAAIRNNKYDLILADFSLPQFDAFGALSLCRKICPKVPFICVSGRIGEETAIELIKAGAVDYVLKDRLKKLPFSVTRALAEAKVKEALIRAEIVLNESEQSYRTLADSGNTLIWTTDTNKFFNYFNLVWLEYTGWPMKHELDDAWAKVVHPDDLPHCLNTYNEAFDKREKFSMEYRIKRRDGEYRWFIDEGCPRFDSEGEFIGYIGHCIDNTDRKLAELELVRAKEKAEESDHLKTAFLHNISHEIRTPMNSIIGFSELINDPDLLSEKRNEYTGMIVQNCNQLLSIITDIVSIATIEAGQEKILEKEMDLNETLSQLYRQFLLKVKNQNLSLVLSPFKPENEEIILTDKTKLVQILSNLIDNALKFTLHGYVNFGYSIVGSEIEFFVKDTGIGIPEELDEEIFKRFRQVETTTTRQFGGSGLGLTISKAYTELLGGRMWLDSQLGKGTTIYFTIPYKKVEEMVFPELKLIQEPVFKINGTKTVLIAEDEDTNFFLLEELLSGLNIRIIRALNGAEAVDICRLTHNVDLVLMDIKMPVMDGFTATKLIREFKSDLPIIAQTAYSDERDRQKALAMGCSDYISKPFKRTMIVSKIMEHLG
ncbi:MAG: response regulator [Bacteroidota bacterium]|nr:response regulator [Bacteroidota bacterium]